MKKEHILIIRFSAIGDVVMMVPVVWALARQYPQVHFTVLSRNFARTLFDRLAPNVSFMGADLKKEYRGFKGLNALYRRLAAKQFTAVADLHNVLRSEYLRLRFIIGRFRVEHIDKHRKGRRQLVKANNRHKTQQPTSFQNYADVFARLGYPVDVNFTSIYTKLPPLPGDIAAKTAGEAWIGIAPFSAHPQKEYPVERMQQVIDMLLDRHPSARIFFFGRGQQEDRYFAEWCTQHPTACLQAKDLTNSLDQELALMSHLDVMLSMDSANMHLASLTGIPVVSVWGATHPLAGFMGWGQKTENVVQTDLDCRPCSIYGQKACRRGDFACMNSIAPKTIVARIEQNLNAATTNNNETTLHNN